MQAPKRQASTMLKDISNNSNNNLHSSLDHSTINKKETAALSSSSSTAPQEEASRVKVLVRIRPYVKRETGSGPQCVFLDNSSSIQLVNHKTNEAYKYK